MDLYSKTAVKIILIALFSGVIFRTASAQALEVEDKKDVFFSLTRTQFDASKLPTNTSVIDSEKIKTLGVQNAGQIVDLLPSVNTQKTSGLGSFHAPKIRGFLNKQIAVFVDNRRIPRDLTGNVDLSQIPAESIDKIEVVRGAGSVLYGPDAEGGVIHILTKKATGYLPSISANAQWGSYGAELYSAGIGTKKERAEGYITASRNKADNFQKNSTFDNTSVNGNLGYDAGTWGKTMFYFSHSQSQVGLPSGTTLQIAEWDGERERIPRSQFSRQHDTQNSFEAEHVVSLFEKVTLTGRLMNSDLLRESLSTSTGPVSSRSRVNRKSAYFQADSFFGLTGGFEYYRDEIRSPFSALPQSNGYGVFVQQTLDWRNLTTIAGVRFDNNTEWGDSTNPRLSLIYQAFPWLKFSGNIGHSFQSPTFADLTDFDSATFAVLPRAQNAPALSPESTWHYDVGFEVIPHPTVVGKVTVFRADTRDRLVFGTSPDGTRSTTSNLQKAFNQGVEVEVSHTLTTWMTHAINYSYLQSEGKGQGFSDHFVELSFVPNNRINYLNDITLPFGFGLGNTVRFVQQQYTGNNRTGQKLPDYVTWDSEVSYKWKDIKLRFGVNNLLEQRYAENGSSASAFGPAVLFPQPCRTFWGGVSVSFL